MSQMRWFRFYSEALYDAKVQTLTPRLFRHWVNLLCLASEQAERGSLPSLREVAFALRVKPGEARAILLDLGRAGLLDAAETGRVSVHNWTERQRKSDDVATRVARHRAENATKEPGIIADSEDFCNVTGNDDVTPQERELEKERELEQETHSRVARSGGGGDTHTHAQPRARGDAPAHAHAPAHPPASDGALALAATAAAAAAQAAHAPPLYTLGPLAAHSDREAGSGADASAGVSSDAALDASLDALVAETARLTRLRGMEHAAGAATLRAVLLEACQRDGLSCEQVLLEVALLSDAARAAEQQGNQARAVITLAHLRNWLKRAAATSSTAGSAQRSTRASRHEGDAHHDDQQQPTPPHRQAGQQRRAPRNTAAARRFNGIDPDHDWTPDAADAAASRAYTKQLLRQQATPGGPGQSGLSGRKPGDAHTVA